MDKGIFKVGDKLYHLDYGWGKVKYVCSDGYVMVNFNGLVHSFTTEGKYLDNSMSPSLSFTEYNLVTGGFSQERPEPDWSQYIGKWGRVTDHSPDEDFKYDKESILLRKLDKISGSSLKFVDTKGTSWGHFYPLTEEQIKILELE